MFKKIASLILGLVSGLAVAQAPQSYTYPALSTNNVFTNTNTFSDLFLNSVIGSMQCIQVDSFGHVSGTGSICSNFSLQSTALPYANRSGAVPTALNSGYRPRLPRIVSGQNIQFNGDSICTGTGATVVANGWTALLASYISSGTVAIDCVSGSTAGDVFNDDVMGRPVSAALQGNAFYSVAGGQLVVDEFGTNDANSNLALNANQQVFYSTAAFADIAIPAMARQEIVLSNNASCTTTGSNSRDTFYLSMFGTLLTSANATLTCTIVTKGAPLYIVYPEFNGDTGLWNLTLDGSSTPATDTVTNSSSLSNAPFGGATYVTGFSYTRTGGLARFPVAAGTHTFSINCQSPGTNGCGFILAGTVPYNTPEYQGNIVAALGVIPQQGDGKGTATAAYDSLNLAACNTLLNDGLNVVCVPVRNWIDASSTVLSNAMSSSYGSGGNATTVTGCTLTSGSTVLSCPSVGTFGSGDLNKMIFCPGAGAAGATLYTSIFSNGFTTVTPTQILLSTAAGTTLSGTASCTYGFLGDVWPPSSSPGEHPDDYGHWLIFRAVAAGLQAVSTASPSNFNTIPNFTAGINVSGGILSATNAPITSDILIQNQKTPSLTYVTGGAAGTSPHGYVVGGNDEGDITVYLGTSPSSGNFLSVIFNAPGSGASGGSFCSLTQNGQATNYGLGWATTNTGINVTVATSLATAASPYSFHYDCRRQVLNSAVQPPFTSYSVTSNIITFFGTNQFSVAGKFIPTGTGDNTIDGQLLVITGETSSQWTATLTHANVSSTSCACRAYLAY